MTGASASVSFVSWTIRTSGAARSSHHSIFSSRAFRELTFHVAIRIAASVPPAALAGEIERGGVGDGHHGHRPGLDGIRDDEVDGVRDRTDHVECDDWDAVLAELPRGPRDVTAHDRAGEDEEVGTRQVGDGADGSRDRLLTDERNRVDADPLAAEVVSVGLAHGT